MSGPVIMSLVTSLCVCALEQIFVFILVELSLTVFIFAFAFFVLRCFIVKVTELPQTQTETIDSIALILTSPV